MGHVLHCNRCVAIMRDADTREESVHQDCLCIACRTAAEKDREEDAVASFCEGMPNPVADWFTNIITKCGFEFSRRLPADINETATALFYECGKLQLQCHGVLPRITLTRPCAAWPTQADWFTELHCPTPERIVLATIKAAMEETK